MPFAIGQKVVYIGPDFRSNPFVLLYQVNLPLPDQVYAIRSPELISRGSPGYLLEEVVNPHVGEFGQEMLIDTKFLRPLVDVKDQAFFTQGAPSGTKWLDNRKKVDASVKPRIGYGGYIRSTPT